LGGKKKIFFFSELDAFLKWRECCPEPCRSQLSALLAAFPDCQLILGVGDRLDLQARNSRTAGARTDGLGKRIRTAFRPRGAHQVVVASLVEIPRYHDSSSASTAWSRQSTGAFSFHQQWVAGATIIFRASPREDLLAHYRGGCDIAFVVTPLKDGRI